MMLKYNINDHMYVQITDEGWFHLLETVGQDYIDNYIKHLEVERDGEIWYKMKCWSVFDLMPPVFGGKPLFMPGVMIEGEGIEEVKGMKGTKTDMEYIAKIKNMPIGKVEDTIQKIINSEIGIMSEHKEETIHDKIRELLEEYHKETGIRINNIGIYWEQRGIGEDKVIMDININSTKTRY